MPKKKSVAKKEQIKNSKLKQKIPLLYLLLILIVVLSLSFLIVLRKYFVLKIEHQKLLKQTQTTLVKLPVEKMIKK